MEQRHFRPPSLTLLTRRDRLCPLMKLLITLSFIAMVAANSLAVISPYTDAQSCPMACCQYKPYSSLSRVCCVTQCKEPGGTQGSSATTILAEARYRDPAVARPFSNPETDSALIKKFNESPAANSQGSSNRYLQGCSLLI